MSKSHLSLDVKISELVDLLKATMGEEKARTSLQQAIVRLGFEESVLYSVQQALDILDVISQGPGLVGITARLAKSKLRMRLIQS
jgi:hypothetical protein